MVRAIQTTDEIQDRDPWEQLPDEPTYWYSLFDKFRLMGPTRTLRKFYRQERAARGKRDIEVNEGISSYWSKMATNWRWRERAEAWDEVVREGQEDEVVEVLGAGLALSHERIRKLELLAEKLEGLLFDPANKRPSPYLVEQYRGVLDDIAKEKGERGKEIKIGGTRNGPPVIFTEWGRGGTATNAWDQIEAPSVDAIVVEEVEDAK